jgi:phosphate transport system substrate-binding protein
VKALVLDRQTLADIFQAKITKWNDPAIVKLNPDAKLAETNITVIHRSDSSGTTEAFTKALNSFSETWKKDNGGPGAGSTIEWPVDAAGNGIGAKGNPGVAVAVSSTPNSIGYVELSYAKANNLVFAQLINKADKNVTANAETLAAAMSEGKFDNNLNASIFDGSGENAWPISTYTYLILHTTSMTDCVKTQKLLEYIQWTLTDPAAAKIASDKGYAVLPAAVLETVKAKLAEVTCNGQPVVSK